MARTESSRRPSHTDDMGGRRATIAAFLANLGIAAAKFVAFLATGAASLLAEAVHSVADTGNQGLLLWGQRRARQTPTADHPFGFGRERYFWAFVVALVLFTGGSLFALVEGIDKLRNPHELSSIWWAVGVLVVAMVLESFSLRTAVHESLESKRPDESWFAFVRRSKTPELAVILLEDTGALIGLLFALIGVTTAEVTGDSRYDAIGSLAIGVLLGVIALTLAIETKSLLIGESAPPEQIAEICRILMNAGVDAVLDLRTEQIAPEELLVVATVFVDTHDAHELEAKLAAADEAIRARIPEARLVYLEPVGVEGLRQVRQATGGMRDDRSPRRAG